MNPRDFYLFRVGTWQTHRYSESNGCRLLPKHYIGNLLRQVTIGNHYRPNSDVFAEYTIVSETYVTVP